MNPFTHRMRHMPAPADAGPLYRQNIDAFCDAFDEGYEAAARFYANEDDTVYFSLSGLPLTPTRLAHIKAMAKKAKPLDVKRSARRTPPQPR